MSRVYAGIDEAGYGPLFGPLLVGRSVFIVPDELVDAEPATMWKALDGAVCRSLAQRRGRRAGNLLVNDSKKLTTASAGIGHLELSCLAFAAQRGMTPRRVDYWLDCLGERSHRDLRELPWYQPTSQWPWQTLPTRATAGQVAVGGAMLNSALRTAKIDFIDFGAAVVFENRFNYMVRATRSKASTSFTFVAGHLNHIFMHFGAKRPFVVVDRQGGRTRYRDLLAMNFPDAELVILEESNERSIYEVRKAARVMTVRFEVGADETHLPVSLASMISKYTRELLMQRFNAYFTTRLPRVRPTAGYGTDGKRFREQVEPHLSSLGIAPQRLCRLA